MDPHAIHPGPDPRADAVTAMADGLAASMRIAAALAQSGRAVDLAGIDQAVGRLCAQALDLPPEQGRSLRPRLVALVAAADAVLAALGPPGQR